MKRNTNGITLIALIITIIILLILAMVTINILINQGIIGHANNAVRGYEVAEEKELIALAYQNYKMDKVNNKDAEMTIDGATTDWEADENTWYIEFTKTHHNYSLTENGDVATTGERWKNNNDGELVKGDMKLKVGDYVDYAAVLPDVTVTEDSQIIKDLAQYSGNTYYETANTPDTVKQEKDLQWRVFDIKGGKIRLISAKTTQSKICLQGYNGYNNAVYLLNEYANEMYSSEYGKAHSMNLEDLLNVLSPSRVESLKKTQSYGQESDMLSSFSYPNICQREKGVKIDGVTGEMEGSQQNGPVLGCTAKGDREIKVIATTMRGQIGSASDFRNTTIYQIIMRSSNDSFWVASRAISERAFDYCVYGVSDLSRYSVFEANSLYGSMSIIPLWGIKPIVTLNSDVVITKDADHDGTSSKPCTIQ